MLYRSIFWKYLNPPSLTHTSGSSAQVCILDKCYRKSHAIRNKQNHKFVSQDSSLLRLLACFRFCAEADWCNFALEFQRQQVLFFPASLYLKLLQQGVADMGTASLIILDEVHHAVKDHPMSTILKDFHWTLAAEAAPKVSLASILLVSARTVVPLIQ